MSHHTEFLNIMAETLSPDDDNYEEALSIARENFGFGLLLCGKKW